jgi:HD superfamily phosphohydrolase
MKPNKRIRTVLYGDQRLSGAELEILHTPAMQRLYGLRQLGFTDRIFIDASHARIHHVVGVLEQVDKLVSAIINNLGKTKRTLRIGSSKQDHRAFNSAQLVELVTSRKPVIRLIGLLHDLTHAPFGHTVEDEIQLVRTKHDEPSRQADAFYRLLCQLVAWLSMEATGPDFEKFPNSLRPFLSNAATMQLPDPLEVGALAKVLLSEVPCAQAEGSWRLSRYDVAELLAQVNCAMTALLHLEALHHMELSEKDLPENREYEFQSVVRNALQGTEFEPMFNEFQFWSNRDAFMLDIVGNTVCADLLDYAKRDSHFAGLCLDYDSDRIAENFTLVNLDESEYEQENSKGDADGRHGRGRVLPPGSSDPFAGSCLRTAISLISHKYRTDIPSELMNLLNVRFYLYERVIFHPTKCAAGSMLGTGLQILGWRSSGMNGNRPTLPDHLRFVGDDVFLHDIRAALDFTLDLIAKLPGDSLIEAEQIADIENLDRVHNGLVNEILKLRIGQLTEQTRKQLAAARLILDRLAARRYFRPVFRALPSSHNKKVHKGAKKLAEIFKNPDVRYDAERQIEIDSDLPLGTITIHCPARTTARKIANVLLIKSDLNDGEEIYKLRDISKLDPETFGEHEKAVEAVKEMYGSMWRLMVYVAPEHIAKYKQIGDVVGRVIISRIDSLGEYAGQPEAWANDPHLLWELETKMAPKVNASVVSAKKRSDFGESLGSIGDRLQESGQIGNIPPEFFDAPDNFPEIQARLEKAIVGVIRPRGFRAEDISKVNLSGRSDELLRLFRTYAKRVTKKDTETFKVRNDAPLSKLSREGFADLYSKLQGAVVQSHQLEQRAAVKQHSGHLLKQFQELLDDELHKLGVFRSSKGNPLFSGS